jgi:ribosomal protein S18 acetylase RimI-like enzyme
MADYKLINNSPKYWDFIRTLRNMNGVRQGFVKQDIITLEMQTKYMNQYSSCFYICLYDEKPAGYIGVIEDDIRVATHPDFQGLGIGSFMVNEAMKKHPNAVAKVKLDNESSVKLFESCGFEKKFYILEKQ